ncbi:MAG: sodium-dependent bicarbonate transport family permease [Longimicrobiales bacterium]|nr:sodium-dependent bicarbonate transport family permease [Longimicrobiales bacterium]
MNESGALLDILRANLLSPIPLAFALGVAARLLKSEFSLPRDIYAGLGIYLLFALGLKGGVELGNAPLAAIVVPALVTLGLGVIRPLTSYGVLRSVGRMGVADSAGIAAHYGSVSAVTFIAALAFTDGVGLPAEGFMPTLLAILEVPGIAVALMIGAVKLGGDRPTGEVLHEVLTGRTLVLLGGGLLVGALSDPGAWEQVKPFYDGAIFKGALVLFLLEMGVVAGERLADLKETGAFLLVFGVVMAIAHGLLGAAVGTWAGLSPGGATVLASMAASASYIAAPPAVRMTIPEANPTLSLTAALAITFPFNIVAGIPLYLAFATWLAG